MFIGLSMVKGKWVHLIIKTILFHGIIRLKIIPPVKNFTRFLNRKHIYENLDMNVIMN